MCVCLFVRVCVCDSNLVVRRGKPEEVVADLIKQLGSVSSVAFHEEVLFCSPLIISVDIDNFMRPFLVIRTRC